MQAEDLRPAGAGDPDVAEGIGGGEGPDTDGDRLDDRVRRGVDARDRVRAAFGTKTVPSAATAAFSGPWPTRIVATTFRLFGSIRETVFEPLFETQIAPLETATDRGLSPTRTLVTRFVRASIRKTRRPKSEPTQTTPPR